VFGDHLEDAHEAQMDPKFLAFAKIASAFKIVMAKVFGKISHNIIISYLLCDFGLGQSNG